MHSNHYIKDDTQNFSKEETIFFYTAFSQVGRISPHSIDWGCTSGEE